MILQHKPSPAPQSSPFCTKDIRYNIRTIYFSITLD
jgi:hypothetical protein